MKGFNSVQFYGEKKSFKIYSSLQELEKYIKRRKIAFPS